MPDITAISAALASLRTSTDLAKAMLGLRDANLVREKALELTAEIFTARESALATQAAQSALLSEIADLKAQIMQFEDWGREAERYQLSEIASGTFAYTVKDGMQAGEPAHCICATCYQSRKRSILQAFDRDHQWTRTHLLRCDTCKAEVVVGTSYIGPGRMAD